MVAPTKEDLPPMQECEQTHKREGTPEPRKIVAKISFGKKA
jgi:hypothetical protein